MRLKLELPKFNNVINFLLVILLTSILFLLTLLALPKTEDILKTPPYDLHTSDNNYWTKQYTITIGVDAKDLTNKWKFVNQTKNILNNRFNQIGVYDVRYVYEQASDTNFTYLITVTTDKDVKLVDLLIQTKGDVKIVVKKDSVVFNTENDPYAQFNPESYDDTNLTRDDFRSIYISKLKTTADDYAYFGIFKPWLWNNKKFYNVLSQNSGKEGGINIDGFVTPTTFPIYEDSSSGYRSAKPILTFAVGTDPVSSQIQNIILNSGNITTSYTPEDSKELTYNKSKQDMYKYIGIITVSTLISLLILNLFVTKIGYTAVITYTLSSILLIDYLKITQLQESTLMLNIYNFILVSLLIIFLNTKSRNLIALTLSIISLIGLYILKLGLFVQISKYLLLLIIFALISEYFVKTYLKLFRKVVSK